MLGLLIFVLKIIGIILLVLLAFVFLLLAAVLFIPVRYRGKGSYYGKPEGAFRITWLLHLISVEAVYRETLELTVRVLGFRLFKEKGKKAEADLVEEPLLAAQELAEEILDPKTEEEAIQAAGEADAQKQKPASQEDLVKELEQEIHSFDEAEGEFHSTPGGLSGTSGQERPPQEEQTGRAAGKKGLGKRIGDFFRKLSQRGGELFRRIKLSVRLLLAKYRLLIKQKDGLLMFLRDGENQKTFRLIKRQAVKVLRHLLPRKLKGEITFGFEDPYITGQILSGAALFYPLYHKNVFLTPVFDRQIIEGRLSFKGRIRLGTLLILGLRLLLHKNFRVLLKKFLNQGGN